jgi:branched-chain amino acid transport system permease protein
MVYGIIQLINFAHGEVVMIGCMVAFSVIVALAGSGMPPLVIVGIGTLVAVPVCMIVGFVVERAAYGRLRHAPRLAPLITAIGVSIILQHLALLVWSRNIIAVPADHRAEALPLRHRPIRARAISNVQIAIIIASVLMMAGLLSSCTARRWASRCGAVSQNPQVAGLMGVDIDRVISITFVIGAALGAVAGVMVGTLLRHRALPDGIPAGPQGFQRGGARRHRQPRGRGARRHPHGTDRIAGRRLRGRLRPTSASSTTSFPASRGLPASPESSLFGSNYKDVYAFIVLILVLVFRPQGLLGERVGTARESANLDRAAIRVGVGLRADRDHASWRCPSCSAMAGTALGAHHELCDALRAAFARAQHRRGFAGFSTWATSRSMPVGAYAYALLPRRTSTCTFRGGRSCRSVRRSLASSGSCSARQR